MSAGWRQRAMERLEAILPHLEQDFELHGPLREVLPPDLRRDVLRTFTEILCQAIHRDDASELGEFVERVVWMARTQRVPPTLFLAWLDQYRDTVRQEMHPAEWEVTDPILAVARSHIVRVQN